jgi:DNA topoisomerase IA
MTQINELHREIIDNIGAIQNKTSKILIEQESDIRRFFNKKIGEIKEKFKEDRINKSEKDQEYQQKEKQMASELEWIKNIAHKIDD